MLAVKSRRGIYSQEASLFMNGRKFLLSETDQFLIISADLINLGPSQESGKRSFGSRAEERGMSSTFVLEYRQKPGQNLSWYGD